MGEQPKGSRSELAISTDPQEISRDIQETRERLSDTIAALIYKTERPVRFIDQARHVIGVVRRRAATITQVATEKRSLPARAVALTELAAGYFHKGMNPEEPSAPPTYAATLPDN